MNFYPGPSKLYPSVEKHLQEAYSSGILSQNHRSKTFSILLEECIFLLKNYLKIPTQYEIVFTSSATECWEIIAQSMTSKQNFHLYNGAFGEKWYNSTQKITQKSSAFSFEINEELPIENINISAEVDLICITQNETSNGTQIRNNKIAELRKKFSTPLIAVDATSSMGGIFLDFSQADIWFASVQKCFGLPSGLAILAFSPKAIAQGMAINEKKHYNSFVNLYENAKKSETAYTPNILGIFLLKKQLETLDSIEKTNELLTKRIENWHQFLTQKTKLKLLQSHQNTYSDTVLAIETENISDLLEKASKENIILGKGYGNWKSSTFRIANFPAISQIEIKKLQHFLEKI